MLNLNGTLYTTEEELEIAMDGLDDEQKYYLRNDFRGCANPNVPLSDLQQIEIEQVLENAIAFGAKCIREFSAQNVLLGITQAGMTGTVLTILQGVLQALLAGSILEAIARIRAVDPADYDGTFLNETRCLAFINKLETYLGIPLSTSI